VTTWPTWFAGDATVERCDANQCFAIENGDGDLRPEQLKFLFHFGISGGFIEISPQDATGLQEAAGDSGLKGKLEMFKQV